MSTITKKELIDRITESTRAKRVLVQATVQKFLDEVISELAKGNRLEFRDFGVFQTKTRAARRAQNPKTMERVHVPAKRIVKFKMGRLMKQKVNTPKDVGKRLIK
ncbi:MAG: HU family DNA-binding protein [Sedimentisphaerales bacterium]|jgi:integration host factor subunit beta